MQRLPIKTMRIHGMRGLQLVAVSILALATLPFACSTANGTLSVDKPHQRNFLEEIFEKYGHDGVITPAGLDRLIRRRLDTDEYHPEHEHDHDHEHHHEHDHHNAKDGKQTNVATLKPDCDEHGSNQSETVRCMNTTEILREFGIDPETGIVTHSQFKLLCPAIVYQLEHRHCEGHSLSDNDNSQVVDSVTWTAWIYATTGVLIISVTGFLCVATVKIIVNKVFYKKVVQLHVALAVGALSGDALLHLLPHALTPQTGGSHSHHHGGGSESYAVWRGLVAFGGIFTFFITQRLLQLCRTKKSEEGETVDSVPSNALLRMKEADEEQTVGEKLCKHRYNSCGYCFEDRFKDSLPMSDKEKESYELLNLTCDSKELAVQSKELPDLHEHSHNHDDEHGHHGHSHDVPITLSSVVWMVIVGDGIHNFIDGLAIGAAFSESVTGGVGTCVAVLCHELPHELGDFAMLLQKGMTIKRALQFNCLSSLICFSGMIVGLSLGNIASATSWVFAFAGGIFLYLALVNMMPELNVDPTDKDATTMLMLQCSGMLCGSAIMLLIAVYEHDLQNFIA